MKVLYAPVTVLICHFIVGHFARDCPQKEDRGPMTCRKCGEEGHMARECPNAEQRGPMACHNCGQEGHMSRDCVEPKDPSRMKCRNCDEMGHNSRECPKPRDYSRVQCRNCGESKWQLHQNWLNMAIMLTRHLNSGSHRGAMLEREGRTFW